MGAFVILAAVGWLVGAAPVAAGSLDDAMRSTRDGRIDFEFAAREGVYGDGRTLVVREGSTYSDDCCDLLDAGPAFAQLVVREGVVTDVDVRVGRRAKRARAEATVDLGAVSAAEAADFLLALVERARGGDLDDAVMGAAIAEDFHDWERIIALARDHERPHGIRKCAVFWLGRAAGAEAARGLVALVDDENTELRLREHAIFSLSQRDADECVEPLTRVATRSKHPQLREKALFWLAQIDDPRVVDVFEEILVEK